MEDETECMKSVTQLINIMKNIFAIYKGNAGVDGNGLRKITDMLAKYETILIKQKQLPFKVHAKLFIEVYSEHRPLFLNMIDDAEFLSTKSVTIWFGQENEAARKQNIKLPINICYEKAKLMYEPLEAQLRKNKRGENEDDEHNSRIMEKPEYTMYYELQYALLNVIYYSLGQAELTKDLKIIRRNLKEYHDIIFLNEEGEVQGSTMHSVLAETMDRVGKMTGKNLNMNFDGFAEHAKTAENMLADGKMMEAASEFMEDISKSKPVPGQSITEMMIENLRVHGPKLEQVFGNASEPRPEGVTTEGKEHEPSQPKLQDDEIEFV